MSRCLGDSARPQSFVLLFDAADTLYSVISTYLLMVHIATRIYTSQIKRLTLVLDNSHSVTLTTHGINILTVNSIAFITLCFQVWGYTVVSQ